MNEIKPLIVVVGPTASGKSALAMELAKQFYGEIICADSQTIRRDMNIGTAKPSQQDQTEVRHHLLDVIDPYEQFSAAEFKTLANKAIDDITSRGKMPIMVGGTGLYIDAVIFDFEFSNAADPELRKRLAKKSVEDLQTEIIKKGITMPSNLQNPRHLIRSLESGGMVSQPRKLRPNTLLIGIDVSTEELSERIEVRVDQMLEDGFIDEVKAVINKYGYPPAYWDAIGYKVIAGRLDEHMSVPKDNEDLRQALIVATRQYAKRQRTWFKRSQDIYWANDFTSARAWAENWLIENKNKGKNNTINIEL